MFQVGHRGGLDEIDLHYPVEAAARIPVREITEVLLVNFQFRHPVLPELFGILGHLGHQFVVALRRCLVLEGVLLEDGHKFGLVHREHLLHRLSALVERVDVLLHGVP